MCGVGTENCPPGFKTGDQISPPGGYVGGGLQMQTDIAVDPAGNVWAINKLWAGPDFLHAQFPKWGFSRRNFCRKFRVRSVARDSLAAGSLS